MSINGLHIKQLYILLDTSVVYPCMSTIGNTNSCKRCHKPFYPYQIIYKNYLCIGYDYVTISMIL